MQFERDLLCCHVAGRVMSRLSEKKLLNRKRVAYILLQHLSETFLIIIRI